MENTFVQFDGIYYRLIVGIPMATNCARLIADLFFILFMGGFYVKPPEIQTVWPQRQDLRYLSISYDIFTIDNPEFA